MTETTSGRAGLPWKWIALGGVTALLVIVFAIGNSPRAREKAGRREAIENCWQEQGKKSADPADSRSVAGACESLEQEFLEDFGRKP